MRTNVAQAQPPTPTETARRLVSLLGEREPENDRRAQFAAENIATLREAGLLGLTVPVASGGLGAGLGETTETLRTLAQGSPSTSLMLAMHSAILANYLLDPLAVPSAERESFIEQREWAFSQAMAGKLFAVANSEPGAGGDVHNSKATVDSGRALSGVKTFCSMGTNADYFMAAARAEEEGVEYFLVRKEENRVTCERPWDGVGMRSSESVTLRFQNAPTLGYLGYRGMLDGINNRHWSTLAFTAIFIGTAESLLEEIIDSSEAILQQASAIDLQLTLQACRAFLRHCVDTEPARADQAYRQLVRDCKLFVTRSLAREASALFIVQSGSAYRFSSGLSRKLRDLLAGPMLRPPIGMTFDTLWEELAEGRG